MQIAEDGDDSDVHVEDNESKYNNIGDEEKSLADDNVSNYDS